MSPWISRETAAEWPPQWPDTAVVQVRLNVPSDEDWYMTSGGDIAPFSVWHWGGNGRGYADITRARRLDQPKPEPVKGRTVWINEYIRGFGFPFETREEADQWDSKRIALHRVTLGPDTAVWTREGGEK